MLNSSQFARSAVIAVTVIALGAGPAMTRPADQPARSKTAVSTVAHRTSHWTQPRVDGTGVRPADRPAEPAAPAVPLTRADDSSGGAGWLPITLAALTLLILGGAVRRGRQRAHSFHARHV